METNNNLPAIAGVQMGEVQRIMANAPETLMINKQSAEKAVQAADALLANAHNVGMSDALNDEMAHYVAKAKKTVSTMNERRKPFTQIMDAVKKEFTASESALKDKIDEVQGARDGYATVKMAEQRRREQEAREKLAREREAIELAKQAEITLATNFTEHLREAKELLLEKFSEATLATFDEAMNDIAQFSELLTKEIYMQFRPDLPAQYHNADEAARFASAAMNKCFKTDVDTYRQQIIMFKRELFDKKNSKLTELKDLDAADSAERERLENERNRREEAERDRLNRETEEAREKIAAASGTQAAGAIAQAEIAAMAEVGTSEAQVRESYQIEVKNPAGNLSIANMWFQNEGKTMSQEKIDRVTFERMRKFCEKHAMTTGEMIDSPLVTYVEVFRAK